MNALEAPVRKRTAPNVDLSGFPSGAELAEREGDLVPGAGREGFSPSEGRGKNFWLPAGVLVAASLGFMYRWFERSKAS